MLSPSAMARPPAASGSTATGVNSMASGDYSTALAGTATGSQTVAVGLNAQAFGDNSVALGYNAAAGGAFGTIYDNAGTTAVGEGARAGTLAPNQE